MAFIPYFVLGPSFIMSMIGLLHGADQTIPTPKENWQDATFVLAIPVYNEENNIALCLASIKQQTRQPQEIVLFDDMSTDKTVQVAMQFAKENHMNLRVVQRAQKQGKTLALFDIATQSQVDIVGIVDGDTQLKSANYFERLIQELFQGIGIASACGTITSLTEEDRILADHDKNLHDFFLKYPKIQRTPDQTPWQRLQRAVSNAYRNELYLFLQKIIYHSEMTSFGTLIFPIGCAAIYRRSYLQQVLEHYIKIFGFDISDSEDIFLGFAFARQGFRNIQVEDVTAGTMEPRFLKLFHQIFKWSSAYYQCCFYFNNLFVTPLKWPARLQKKWRERHINFQEKRKIKEAYRQVFGTKYTQKYGRAIGWFIFATAIEKISFPLILLVLILLQYWQILLITIVVETSFRALFILFLTKTNRFRHFFNTFLFSPIHYAQVLFDLAVLARFMFDLWITKNRHWRK